MCLDTVKESYDSPSSMIVDGWKSFEATGKKLRVQMPINGSKEIPLDKWVKATTEHAPAGVKTNHDHNIYEAGFHAYRDEADVERVKRRFAGAYRRVFLRGITCTGQQDGFVTVIAREMFVPSSDNVWPPTKAEEEKSILQRAKDIVSGNA